MLLAFLMSAMRLVLVSAATGSAPSPNLPCKSMRSYMPPAMSQAYNMSKHNGTWCVHLLQRRIPVPAHLLSASMLTHAWCSVSLSAVPGPGTKSHSATCTLGGLYTIASNLSSTSNEEHGFIDDYFVFTCYPAKLNYISPQRENATNQATGRRHENGLFDMYVRHSDFKFITHYEWNTEMIGFKDDGGTQYKWVIEYQCGTRPDLPLALCLGKPSSDNKCYFTGVQMYVRDRLHQRRSQEMLEYLRSLGPQTSGSR